jgi:CspA family cold shock protein
MPAGIVKWFNSAKGYGFISGNDSNEDIFAHFSSITMDGYRTLKRGQSVEFELTVGPKGLHATQIRLKSEQDKPSN